MSFRHRMKLRELFVVYSRLSLTVMADYYRHTRLCCQGYPAAGSAGTNWMELLTFTCSQCLHKGTALCNCPAVPWGYIKYNGPFIADPSPEGLTINSFPSVFMGKDIAKSVTQWTENFNGESTWYHHQDVPPLSHPWSNQNLRNTDCIYLHLTWDGLPLVWALYQTRNQAGFMQDCKVRGEALKSKVDLCPCLCLPIAVTCLGISYASFPSLDCFP